MRFSKVAMFTIAFWAACVLLYGWYSVSETITFLEANPSPDTYANNTGFQIMAFALTKGLASILLLGIVLLVEFSYLAERNKADEKSLN